MHVIKSVGEEREKEGYFVSCDNDWDVDLCSRRRVNFPFWLTCHFLIN